MGQKQPRDLVPRVTVLVVLQPPLEIVQHGVAKLGHRFEPADVEEELRRHLREHQLLDLQDLEARRDAGAPQGRGGRVLAQLGLAFAGLARADARHQLVEGHDLPVAETENRADADHFFLGAGDLAPVVKEGKIRGDVIPHFGRSVLGGQAAVPGQQGLQGSVHVRVAELPHRPLQPQSLPLRQVELGTDLQVELEDQRAVVRQDHRIELEVRFADRRQLFILADLGYAVHQELALDLLLDILAETGFDQPPRGVTRPKAGNVRGSHQLGILLLEVALDVLRRDRHRDVPFTGAPLLDLGLQMERRLLLFPLFFRLLLLIVEEFFGGFELIGVGGIVIGHACLLPKSGMCWGPKGAGDGIRTHDNDVGNVVLYQLSYTRVNVNRYLVITYVIRPSRFPTICTIIGPVRCNPQISSLL